MEIKRNNKLPIPFIHLLILMFLTIGTHSIIERTFSVIDSMDLNDVKYVLVDLSLFTLIGLVYLTIYYFLVNSRRDPKLS